MKVSIVIPTYNCADLVATTLRSIQQGGHEEIEVILMDGGSKDGIAEVVASFGSLVSVFVSESDDGQYDAINKGMSQATGEILCWINGGDFFIPGAIANAVSVFEASQGTEWIAGRPCVAEGVAIRRLGNHEVVVSNPEIRYGLCCGGATGFLQQEGMFWRRTLWERAGALDTRLRLAADYELWIRFSRETDLVRLTIPLAAFSYHDTNRSIVERDAYLKEVQGVIGGFTTKEKRVRKWINLFPWGMRIARKLPVIKELSRFIFQKSLMLSVEVVTWKKVSSGGFKLIISRRVSWIR